MKSKIAIIISSILGGALIIGTTIIFIFAWYTNYTPTEQKVVRSPEIPGLSIDVYCGYDYDFNGVLDAMPEEIVDDKTSKNIDLLNDYYYQASNDDILSGVMDSSVITYRFIIRNVSEYNLTINPYFIFSDTMVADMYASKYFTLLFDLSNVGALDHSFYDSEGLLIAKESRNQDDEIVTSTLFTDAGYDLFNGVFYEDKTPIHYLTNGINSYVLTYNASNKVTRIVIDGDDTYDITRNANGDISGASHNGAVMGDAKLVTNISNLYNADYFDSEGNLIVTPQIDAAAATALYNKDGVKYTMLSSMSRTYDLTNVPSSFRDARKYFPIISNESTANNYLTKYLYEEYYATINVLSNTETYIDIKMTANSSITSMNQAIAAFEATDTYTYLTKHYDISTKKLYNNRGALVSNLSIGGKNYVIDENLDSPTYVDISSDSTLVIEDLREMNGLSYDITNQNIDTKRLKISYFAFYATIRSGSLTKEQVLG